MAANEDPFNEDPFDDDDVPWASPEIQLAYEAALGRFLLAFNRMDNLLSVVLEITLTEAGRPDLVKECARGDLWLKILTLDLLKLSEHGAALRDVPTSLIKQLSADRNQVAHGHFDQNPHSGEYDIVSRKNVRLTYSAEHLDSLTAGATKAWDALRYPEAVHAFRNVSVISPYGISE